MLKVKKQHIGVVNITVDGRTIELNEATSQEDLKTLAADENAQHFIEEVESEEVESEEESIESEASAEGEVSVGASASNKPAKKNK